IAVTDSGVFSFGNSTPLGSSLSSYLLRQAAKRDTTVQVIKTTKDQDAAVIKALSTCGVGPLRNILSDNCSTRSNCLLDAADVPESSWLRSFPGSAHSRGIVAGATEYSIPQGSTTVPDALLQFDPITPPESGQGAPGGSM